MKNVWVISLGGSRIVPDDVDSGFLREFKVLLNKHREKKFVVVCGGGSSARRYIKALRKLGKGEREQSLEGIAITRLHAGFMSRIFGGEANEDIPRSMKRVKNLLSKNRIVFCGALRWRPKNTSDGTAAKLAGFLGCRFVNLTNVRGLYDKDPGKYGSAKFVRDISWKDFWGIVRRIKFEAGQHFVLDSVAAREIMEKRIETFIVGSLKDLDRVLRGRRGGTRIYG
jgi:uridylate kinase